MLKDEVVVLAANGMVGGGFLEDSLNRAMECHPDVICADCGSCDSGPYYLGTATPNKSRKAIKRDLRLMMLAAIKAGVPMMSGSAATAGADPNLEFIIDIVKEIAAEENLHFKLAKIHSEISHETLKIYIQRGKMQELYPAPEVTDEIIDATQHIVGVMGPEPYIEAMKNGAQIIIGGRSSDTAFLAAYPIMQGLNYGPTWHAAKLLECGASCAADKKHSDCMLAWVKKDSFAVEPPNPKFHCTPVSCVSHALYETSDPFTMVEPGVIVDIKNAEYIAENDRRVRIKGSTLTHSPYTIRLEGAQLLGYRQICIGAIRDPLVIGQLDCWIDAAVKETKRKIHESLGLYEEDYLFRVQVYGKTAQGYANEVCLLIEDIAKDQKTAAAIGAVIWKTMLHYPIPEYSGSQSILAFPFSPPSFEAGPAYRFSLNHVLRVDDPLELFPIEYEEV